MKVLATTEPAAEPQSPEAAYEAHFDRVWRTLRRLGVAEAVLDDAAQDVFLVVFRRWDEFHGDSSLATWIYGIVLRVASHYRRARRHAVVGMADDAAHSLPAPGSTPFDEASWREAARLLSVVLEGLDEAVRMAFVLVDLEELTIDAASEILGIGEATCRSRLRTARAHVNASIGRLRAHERWRLA